MATTAWRDRPILAQRLGVASGAPQKGGRSMRSIAAPSLLALSLTTGLGSVSLQILGCSGLGDSESDGQLDSALGHCKKHGKPSCSGSTSSSGAGGATSSSTSASSSSSSSSSGSGGATT